MIKAAIVYQFTILISIVILIGYFAVTTGELNDTLVGALIGVMAGVGLKGNEEIIEVHPDKEE